MEARKAKPGPEEITIETSSENSTRSKFIGRVGRAAAASLAVGATGFGSVAKAAPAQSGAGATPESSNGGNGRAQQSFNIRRNAAQVELNVPIPAEITNGD